MTDAQFGLLVFTGRFRASWAFSISPASWARRLTNPETTKGSWVRVESKIENCASYDGASQNVDECHNQRALHDTNSSRAGRIGR
jgi:hypothetical protein